MTSPLCGRPLPDDLDGWKTRAKAFVRVAAEAQDELEQLRAELSGKVDAVMQDVVDLEYDTCDEDNPDLCHVTRDELSIILRRHFLSEE